MKKILVLICMMIIVAIPSCSNAVTGESKIMKLTHYCPCAHCCEPWDGSGPAGGGDSNYKGLAKRSQYGRDGITSSGIKLNQSNSFAVGAVRKGVYEPGTIIVVSKGVYSSNNQYILVCDNGGMEKNQVDVAVCLEKSGNKPYLASHNLARTQGTKKNISCVVFKNAVKDKSQYQYYSENQQAMKELVGEGTASVATPAQSQVSAPPKEVDVTPDFNVIINGQTFGYIKGNFEVQVDELPKQITLVDQSSHENKRVAWRLYYPSTNEMKSVGSSATQVINLEQGGNGNFNWNKTIAVGLIVEGGKSKVIEITFKVTEPVNDFGLVLKGMNADGTERIKEYTGAETIVVSDTKEVVKEVELVNKSNKDRKVTQWRVYREDKGVKTINGVIENPIELLKEYGTYQDGGSYKMRVGMTLSDGTTCGKDILFKVAEFAIGLDKEEEAGMGESKENAIIVGEIPVNMNIINKSGVKVSRYEIWNQHTGTFDLLYGTGDVQWIYVPAGGYGLFNYTNDEKNEGIISIGLRMVLEDGTVSTREVYFKRLNLVTPLEGEVIDEDEDLVISWKDMGKGIKYAVRVVRYEGEKVYDIYTREIVEGTSFTVSEEYLEDGENYRIAVQPEGGSLFAIRTVTTKDIKTPEIVNIKEGDTVEKGKDLLVTMKEELQKDEKYYLTLYDEKDDMRVLIIGNDNTIKDLTVNGKYLNEEGKYRVEVVTVRSFEYGGEKVTVSSKVEDVSIIVK